MNWKERYHLPVIRRALALLGTNKRRYLALLAVYSSVSFAGTVLFTLGLRGVLNAVEAGDFSWLFHSVLLVLLSHAIWWIYTPFCAYGTAQCSKGAVREFKTSLGEHLFRLPMAYHDRKPAGELLSSLSGDVDCLHAVYDQAFCDAYGSALYGIGGLLLMFLLDWRFALVVLALGVCNIRASAWFAKRLERTGRERQEELGKNSVQSYALLRAAKTIRLLGLEKRLEERFSQGTEREANARRRTLELSARMKACMGAVQALSYVSVLFAGAVFVYFGLSNWGTVAALMNLKDAADDLFVKFGQNLAELQALLGGVQRLLDLADQPEEAREQPALGLDAELPEALRMEKVCFSYDGGAPVLDRLDFSLARTGFTALAGESGCGKSTLMKLLLGLYAPCGGRILFRGEGRADLAAVRRLTAYVPQEAMLFRGTVFENIAFGSPGAAREQVELAARQAGADSFIRSLSNGYDALLADSGKSLSGGQRQRIAIARALVKDAPILLLDEITSALDQESEAHILETIEHLAETRAVLFVTHHAAVAARADRTIVIK